LRTFSVKQERDILSFSRHPGYALVRVPNYTAFYSPGKRPFQFWRTMKMNWMMHMYPCGSQGR
jgi:hypothetical protein